MKVTLNTYSPNFGTVNMSKRRETRLTVEKIINRDNDVAEALKNVRDRIDSASGDMPVTLWGRSYYNGDVLYLSSIKYQRRNCRGGLPRTREIKPETTKEEKIEILNDWATDFEIRMGKGESPVSKTVDELFGEQS